MTAAVARAAERVFANTPIIRIFAAAYASNPALQRVLAEAGFRFGGAPRFCRERSVRERLLL